MTTMKIQMIQTSPYLESQNLEQKSGGVGHDRIKSSCHIGIIQKQSVLNLEKAVTSVELEIGGEK